MQLQNAISVHQEAHSIRIEGQIPTPIADSDKMVEDVLRAPGSPASKDIPPISPIAEKVVPDPTIVMLSQQGSNDGSPEIQDVSSPDKAPTSRDQSENNPVNGLSLETVSPVLKEPGMQQSSQRLLRSSSPSKRKYVGPAVSGQSSLSTDENTRPVLDANNEDHAQIPGPFVEGLLREFSTPSKKSQLRPATPLASIQPLASAEKGRVEESIPAASCLNDLETPQIGTTLLRRESLRRKESPSKKTSSKRVAVSPRKKQLKKRDTLQEREILQKFSEGSKTDQPPYEEPIQDDSVSASVAAPFAAEPDLESDVRGIELEIRSKTEPEQIALNIEETILESKDLQRAVEAIEIREDATKGVTQDLITEIVSDKDSLHQANVSIAKAEFNEAKQTVASVCEKAELPVRKTRSGTRFSDDTSMLKDFLDRVQARKAAKAVILSPKVPKSLQESPKRSPRKKTWSRGANTSSPLRPEDLAPNSSVIRSGTPPGKSQLVLFDPDDAEEQIEEPASCRRSTRTRLPGPSKAPPGAPSFIPVRRADGTDPVVLQRTEAQELAITTRTNTRRNKGQSKPPPLALQDLPVEQEDVSTTTKQRAANAKAVAWAEKLAAYQESKEVVEEAEDQRPKVRRMRGLGAVNGTPAAKRTTAVVAPSNGTPAPKRRGRL